MARSECTGCSQVFTSVTAFDMHRVGGYGDPIYRKGKIASYTESTRRCLTIDEMKAKGMTQTTKGWWTTGTFDYDRPTRTSAGNVEDTEDEQEEEESA